VSDLWVVGDLRTLLFAGGQGLANSTFSHVSGLPDLFMEHDIGALQGQENFPRKHNPPELQYNVPPYIARNPPCREN
jgi:hypothetical protein